MINENGAGEIVGLPQALPRQFTTDTVPDLSESIPRVLALRDGDRSSEEFEAALCDMYGGLRPYMYNIARRLDPKFNIPLNDYLQEGFFGVVELVDKLDKDRPVPAAISFAKKRLNDTLYPFFARKLGVIDLGESDARHSSGVAKATSEWHEIFDPSYERDPPLPTKQEMKVARDDAKDDHRLRYTCPRTAMAALLVKHKVTDDHMANQASVQGTRYPASFDYRADTAKEGDSPIEDINLSAEQHASTKPANTEPEAILFETIDETTKIATLEAAIQRLTSDEQFILTRYFDLDRSGKRWTLEEIGEPLGVTESRISQKKSAALGKIRRYMEAQRRRLAA